MPQCVKMDKDYIHINDLAVGHVLVLKKLFENSGLFIVNLGTGRGCSVQSF